MIIKKEIIGISSMETIDKKIEEIIKNLPMIMMQDRKQQSEMEVTKLRLNRIKNKKGTSIKNQINKKKIHHRLMKINKTMKRARKIMRKLKLKI